MQLYGNCLDFMSIYTGHSCTYMLISVERGGGNICDTRTSLRISVKLVILIAYNSSHTEFQSELRWTIVHIAGVPLSKEMPFPKLTLFSE